MKSIKEKSVEHLNSVYAGYDDVLKKLVKGGYVSVPIDIALRVIEHAKQEMKQHLMKDATDVTVHIDAGGYPYIPQMELYDYDNDVPLAKEGDKYKVILIKED